MTTVGGPNLSTRVDDVSACSQQGVVGPSRTARKDQDRQGESHIEKIEYANITMWRLDDSPKVLFRWRSPLYDRHNARVAGPGRKAPSTMTRSPWRSGLVSH